MVTIYGSTGASPAAAFHVHWIWAHCVGASLAATHFVLFAVITYWNYTCSSASITRTNNFSATLYCSNILYANTNSCILESVSWWLVPSIPILTSASLAWSFLQYINASLFIVVNKLKSLGGRVCLLASRTLKYNFPILTVGVMAYLPWETVLETSPIPPGIQLHSYPHFWTRLTQLLCVHLDDHLQSS